MDAARIRAILGAYPMIIAILPEFDITLRAASPGWGILGSLPEDTCI